MSSSAGKRVTISVVVFGPSVSFALASTSPGVLVIKYLPAGTPKGLSLLNSTERAYSPVFNGYVNGFVSSIISVTNDHALYFFS